jgi:hypothetical protein
VNLSKFGLKKGVFHDLLFYQSEKGKGHVDAFS